MEQCEPRQRKPQQEKQNKLTAQNHHCGHSRCTCCNRGWVRTLRHAINDVLEDDGHLYIEELGADQAAHSKDYPAAQVWPIWRPQIG